MTNIYWEAQTRNYKRGIKKTEVFRITTDHVWTSADAIHLIVSFAPCRYKEKYKFSNFLFMLQL